MGIKSWLGIKDNVIKEGNGLSVSLEELMNMRRYVPYMQGKKRQKTFSCQAGDIKSAFKGRGMEFEEIRAYNLGDDVRDIDWRVTARKEIPYTKLYAEEKDHQIYVWLDLSAPMLFGSKKELKSVAASKIAALLGWVALENKDRFGCVIYDGAESHLYKPQNSRAMLLAILKKIAQSGKKVLYKPAYSKEALLKSLKILEQSVKSRSGVFMLSDFTSVDEDVQKELAALSKKSKLYLVNIFDVLEENPPKAGEYMAEYKGKRLIFDSTPKVYKHDYFAYFANKRKKMRDFCVRFGCQLVEFRTDADIVTNLKII